MVEPPDAVVSLLLAAVVFGFAPGFCLRLIVLAYPRNDPRRAELIAELYAVPRLQRPLWVAEQLEVALFEGLVHRASVALRRRSVLGSMLGSMTATAGVLVIAFAGVGIVAKSAQPSWALNEGDTSRARDSLEKVQEQLDVIDEAEGRAARAVEHRKLEKMLDGTPGTAEMDPTPEPAPRFGLVVPDETVWHAPRCRPAVRGAAEGSMCSP